MQPFRLRPSSSAASSPSTPSHAIAIPTSTYSAEPHRAQSPTHASFSPHSPVTLTQSITSGRIVSSSRRSSLMSGPASEVAAATLPNTSWRRSSAAYESIQAPLLPNAIGGFDPAQRPPLSPTLAKNPSLSRRKSIAFASYVQNVFRPPQFRVYHNRWLVLVLYYFVGASNCIVWMTYAPISDLTEEEYGVDLYFVNSLSLLFMFAHVLLFPWSSTVLDKNPLRKGVLYGATFTVVGSWVRVIGDFYSSYPTVFLGQFIASFGQPFLLNAPTKLVATWFDAEQRTTATSIAMTSSFVGVAACYLYSAFMVENDGDTLLYLVLIAAFSTFSTLMCYFFLENEPPSPPCWSQIQRESHPFVESVKILFSDRNYTLLVIQSCFSLGAINALITVLQQILAQYEYSTAQSGIIGSSSICMGVIGSLIFPYIIDRTQSYKLLLSILLSFSLGLSFIWANVLRQENFIILLSLGSLLGFVISPLAPVNVELACEMAYPMNESIPSGIILAGGELAGALLVAVMNIYITREKVVEALWAPAAALGIALLFALLIKEELKRLKRDKIVKDRTPINSGNSTPVKTSFPPLPDED